MSNRYIVRPKFYTILTMTDWLRHKSSLLVSEVLGNFTDGYKSTAESNSFVESFVFSINSIGN